MIIRDPRPLIGPPTMSMKIPNPPKIILKRINCLSVNSFSPIYINRETSIEFIKIATNKDDPKTTDNVIGM